MRGFLQLLHAVFQAILIHLVKIEAGPDRLQHQDRQLTAEVLTEFLQTVEHAPPSIVASQFQRLSEIPVSQYWGYISLYYAFGAMAAQAVITLLRQIFAPHYDRDLPQQSFS